MHRNALDDAGIIDQNIHCAQLLRDATDHPFDSLLVPHVADITLGLDALGCVLLQRLLQMLLAAAIKGNFSTGLGQSLSHSKAYSVSCTRNERNLTLQ